MSDAAENRRRIERRVAAARVKHMSNTKWRKLFGTINSLPNRLGNVGIKFLNDDRLFEDIVPGPEFDHDDNFGECGGISYAPFAHIEFVQIPNRYNRKVNGRYGPATEFMNDINGLIKQLAELGSFPVAEYDCGIRILGYEWD